MHATLRLLYDRRPTTVIATNPSIVLGYFLLLLRGIFHFRLVSDAHYAGIQAFMGHRILQRVLDYYNRKVDFVIVTNESQAQRLERLGARAYVCPDPLPEFETAAEPLGRVPEKSVLLVCSFDIDEPYLSAFEAFRELQQHGYLLYVSGNHRSANIDISQFPWIRFLGFVEEAVYNDYLRSCSVIMDLTDYEDCLVCGAYEAMALRKATVLSDTTALRNYFGPACVLTANTPAAIGASVRVAFECRSDLGAKAQQWVKQNEVYMEGRIRGLKAALAALDLNQ